MAFSPCFYSLSSWKKGKEGPDETRSSPSRCLCSAISSAVLLHLSCSYPAPTHPGVCALPWASAPPYSDSWLERWGRPSWGGASCFSWRPIILRRGWLLLCGLFLTSSPPSLSGTACQSIRQPASKWEVTLHVLGTGLGAISCCRNLLFSPCLVTTFLCLWHDSAPFFTCVVFCWWVLAVIFDRFVLWFAHCS